MYHINLDNRLYEYSKISIKEDFHKKTIFKAYICNGNNGKIVLTMLKKRWWWNWVKTCNPEEWDFIWTQWLKPKVIKNIESGRWNTSDGRENRTYDIREERRKIKQGCVYNRVPQNYHLANKKNLFLNLKKYYLALGKDPYWYIPMTFLIK